MIHRFFSAIMGQEPHPQIETDLDVCECGCGQKFPRSQMIELRTYHRDHPIERVFNLHAATIYDRDSSNNHLF